MSQDFSPVACSIIQIMLDAVEVDSVPLVDAFKLATRRGFTRAEVQRVIGELAAVERLGLREGRSGTIYVELMDVNGGGRFVDLWEAFESVRETVLAS